MSTPAIVQIESMCVRDQAIDDDEVLTHPAATVIEVNATQILARLTTPQAANTLEGMAVMEFANDTEFAEIVLSVPIEIVVSSSLETVTEMVDEDPTNDVIKYMVNWNVTTETHMKYMRIRVRNTSGGAATYSLEVGRVRG